MTTNDTGDIYALWMDTIIPPSQKVVESISDEYTGLVLNLCMKDLLCIPDGKEKCGDTGWWNTKAARVGKGGAGRKVFSGPPSLGGACGGCQDETRE